MSWKEGGRKFKMERRSNGAGRFLFCLVLTKEVKRFSLIFLERRSHLGGWSIMAEKLCSLGIVPSSEIKGAISPVEVKSLQTEGTVVWSFAEVVRKDPGVVREVAQLQLEGEVKCREEKLRQCLVGWFEETSVQLPNFSWLRNFVTSLWSLKRGVKI